MAKTLDDSVIDGSLNIVKNGATQLCLCSAQPTTYAEATATYMLVLKTGLTAGSFTGPVNGDVSGRKLTVNAISGTNVTNSGTAIYVALCSGTVLLLVDTCTSQVLTAGNTVNTPAFKYEIVDPT
jgi:DNA-binding beta-propeller fold protein YncE